MSRTEPEPTPVRLPAEGAIGPVEREALLDRRGERVGPCYLPEQETPTVPERGTPLGREPLPAPPSSRVAFRRHAPWPDGGDGALLLALGGAVGEALRPWALREATAGRRVWILADEPNFAALADGLDRALPLVARRVPGLPLGAWILGEAAALWPAPHETKERPWRLALRGEDAAALRGLLLRLFWHAAERELRPVEGGMDEAQPAPSPVAPVEAASEQGGWAVGETPPWSHHVAPRLTYIPDGVPEGCALPERLLVPPARLEPERAERLLADGAEVAWRPLALPRTVLGPKQVEFHWQLGSETLRLRLGVEAAGALGAVLEEAMARPRWRLVAESAVGKVERAWFPGEPEPEEASEVQELDAGTAHAATLEGVAQAKPARWPRPRRLARRVRWRWRALPPTVPPGARPDPLLDQWQALRESLAGELQRLAEDARALGKWIDREAKGGAGDLKRVGASAGKLAEETERAARQAASVATVDEARKLRKRCASMPARLERLRERAARLAAEAARRRHEEAVRARLEEERAALRDLEDRLRRLEEDGEKKKEARLLKRERREREQRLEELERQLREGPRRLPNPPGGTAASPTPQRSRPSLRPVSSRSVPKESQALPPVPAEAPPLVGELLRRGSERWLAVARWEELEAARSEAERLDAKLAAPAGSGTEAA